LSRRRGIALSCALAGAALGTLAGPATAAFPGLNGKIAFERDNQVVVKTPGQLAITPLTAAGLGHGENGEPTWSPDGKRIAFRSNRAAGNRFDIYVMNADGSGQQQITFEAVEAGRPAWSPDGTRIAFQTDNGTDTDIVVVNANGTGRLVVVGIPGNQSLPTWRPDGARIVYRDDAENGLASVTPNGTGRAPFVADATQPDFSPDGSKLVVQRSGAIHVLNGDGTGGIQVSPGVGGLPAFSPDGSRIVYFRFNGSSSANDLFTTGSGGPSELAETDGAFVDVGPDWQPIPQAPPPPPPPPAPPAAGAPGAGGLAIGSASFAPKWRASRLSGRLVLRGSVVRAAQLEAQVLRANGKGKPLLKRRFRLTKAGAFTRRLSLARLLPGRYLVRLVDVGRTAPKLATQQVLATLAAPREGVVSRAFISTALGGRPRGKIAAGPGIVFATFRFAALPLKRLPLRVSWYLSGRSGAVERDPKSRIRLVTAFLRSRSGALPAGSYRAELTAGGKLVAVARVRIR
jgi:hypothetical protein